MKVYEIIKFELKICIIRYVEYDYFCSLYDI